MPVIKTAKGICIDISKSKFLPGEQVMKFKHKAVVILSLILTAITFSLLSALPAHAGPEDDSGFSMSVTGIRYLYLENETLEFTPDAEQMLDGWTTTEQSVVWVSANVPWLLTIRGTEEYWEGSWLKPLSDIYWKFGNAEYIPLSTEPENITLDGPINAGQFPIDIRIKLDMETDLPGNYTYTYLLFELSAP